MIEDILLKGHASFHLIRSFFRAQKSDYVKSSFPVTLRIIILLNNPDTMSRVSLNLQKEAICTLLIVNQ